METLSLVRLQGVTKRFDDIVAVDCLNLDIYQGEFLTILGPVAAKIIRECLTALSKS